MAAPVCNHTGPRPGRTAVPNLTIKNLPREVHRSLKERAKRNRRSLNSEVIEILARTLPPPAVDPAEFLARIEAMHRKYPNLRMTPEEIRAARLEGRK
jgi:plasmid stability protein